MLWIFVCLCYKQYDMIELLNLDINNVINIQYLEKEDQGLTWYNMADCLLMGQAN